MKWLKVERNTKTNWDSLFDLWVTLDKINYDLDSPPWYWLRHEWNSLKISRNAISTRINRLSKVVDTESYPSCYY